MKNNIEIPSREASCSNPFDALRSFENGDVLGANWGCFMRAEIVSDEGKRLMRSLLRSCQVRLMILHL